MTLKTNVLVENIYNLSEARYCSGMGVQFLACPAAQVDPTLFAAIKGWIQGPKMIVDISKSAGLPEVNAYEADFILVNTSQVPTTVKKSSLPLIVRLNEEDLSNLDLLSKYVEKIQFVIVQDISKDDFEKLNSYKYEILLATAKSQSTQLSDRLNLSIAGFVLTGETETAPGLKDYDHLSTILEQLEASED